MSALTTIIQDDILAATLQRGLYALAACTVIGTAAYIGYRAAEPGSKHILNHRHPESNEQVRNKNIRIDLKVYFYLI
jgi:hypothetical protein